MHELTIAITVTALLSTAALAQTTHGHAAGHSGTSVNSTMTSQSDMTISRPNVNSSMTSQSGMTNSGITTGINISPSVGSEPERGSPNGSPATAPKATTGPNTQPSNNETPLK